MRFRDNKLLNFILEISQIVLVFLGVYSALMCTATSLDLTYSRWLCLVMMAVAAIVFYGLFTVLETFRKGKMYGLIGITLFFLVMVARFMGAMKKGFVTVCNSFLKEFMNYTGTSLELLPYNGSEGASTRFCNNLLLIVIGVYLIAWISAFFYRRRRSIVFLALTLPFAFLPFVVGHVGHYFHFVTYLIIAITIVGTRHLRTDATDRRMRQKLAILLVFTGVLCALVAYAFMPQGRYEDNEVQLTQAKNSLVALTTWDGEDIFTWMKSYLNGDAITYGKIGKQSEITYTGETMLKVSGDINSEHGLYLKGYVGDVYKKNRWSSLQSEEDYQKDWAELDATGVTIDNWHTQLRNELGDNEISEVDDLWTTGTLRIRNIAFGYGNYLIPCLPVSEYKYMENGRSTVEVLGIDYTVDYYLEYPTVVRQNILKDNDSIADVLFWESNKTEREQLQAFAEKYYLQVPDSLKDVCEDFKQYLSEQNDLLTRYEAGDVDDSYIIQAVKTYISKDTSYTLSPGKTPSGEDTIDYFLNESKKGYCTYYASAATILLRSVGIPARYVEGMYVSSEELASLDGEELEVPDEDSHAWVEVYDDKYGFVTLEVTPGYGEDNASNSEASDKDTDDTSSDAGNDESVDETTEEATPTPNVTTEPEESMEFEDIDGNEEDLGEDATQDAGSSSKIWPRILEILGIVVIIFIAIEAQRRIRRRVFRSRMSGKKPKRRIRATYMHLVPLLAMRSVVYKGQSIHEYATELATAFELPIEDMIEFTGLIYHARFGPDTITEEQLGDFKRIYQSIRQKAYADASWYRKLYYMYIMVL